MMLISNAIPSVFIFRLSRIRFSTFTYYNRAAVRTHIIQQYPSSPTCIFGPFVKIPVVHTITAMLHLLTQSSHPLTIKTCITNRSSLVHSINWTRGSTIAIQR
jgi:hypothetical protein